MLGTNRTSSLSSDLYIRQNMQQFLSFGLLKILLSSYKDSYSFKNTKHQHIYWQTFETPSVVLAIMEEIIWDSKIINIGYKQTHKCFTLQLKIAEEYCQLFEKLLTITCVKHCIKNSQAMLGTNSCSRILGNQCNKYTHQMGEARNSHIILKKKWFWKYICLEEQGDWKKPLWWTL